MSTPGEACGSAGSPVHRIEERSLPAAARPSRRRKRLGVALACGWGLVVFGCKETSPTGRTAEGPPTLQPRVRVDTSLGRFVLKLDGEKAPITTRNFVEYVSAGFYDGTVFHRVLRESMIQGGEYTPDMARKTAGKREPIPNEWGNGLKNVRWSLGMVRLPGVSKSATSGFYINVVDNPELDLPKDGAGYTVFGKVVVGVDTVGKIRDVPVGPHADYAQGRSPVVPMTPVVVRSMTLLDQLDRPRIDALIERALRGVDERINELVAELEQKAGRKAVRSESGLRYIDFVEGTGASPYPGGKVEMYYRGKLLDGTVFESEMENARTLEVDKLIVGLQEGLATMREGGERTLVIPAELAYGSGGVPGRIPSDSPLVFEIKLLMAE